MRLFQNQKVVKEIRQEIHRQLHDQSPENLTYDNVKAFEYTKAVISETLRLHPSVPKQAKVAARDETLPDGTYVPKGAW
jgi:cytochrome P450